MARHARLRQRSRSKPKAELRPASASAKNMCRSLLPHGTAKQDSVGKPFLESDEKLLLSALFSDVTVKCGDKVWQLHKIILCSRCPWFEKALVGGFSEAASGIIEIKEFEPEEIDWVITYIYTGACDVLSGDPSQPDRGNKTKFVLCYRVYSVADYFALDGLVSVALETLAADFGSRLGPIQVAQQSCSDWFPELCELARLVYHTTTLQDADMTPIRFALVSFVHAARFYFLEHVEFNNFLDEEAPILALDLFRAMRKTHDFYADGLEGDLCKKCLRRPKKVNGTIGFYTHVVPQTLKFQVWCSSCAVKDNLGPPISWNPLEH